VATFCPCVCLSLLQKTNLNQHIRACHDGIRFACTEPGCSSSFAFRKSLRAHVELEHSGVTVAPANASDRASPSHGHSAGAHDDAAMEPCEVNAVSALVECV
jgi:hypothetical protein